MSDLVTCPSCSASYVATAMTCVDCGIPLVVGPALEPSEDEVGYDLADWGDEERHQLATTLAGEAIPCRWEGAELVVREPDADHVEELIEEIDNPDALPAEPDEDDGGADILSALYVSADVLQHDARAAAAVIELLEVSERTAATRPPYGLDGGLWAEVQRRTATLADLVGEEADEEAVMGAAKSLREAVRPLV